MNKSNYNYLFTILLLFILIIKCFGKYDYDVIRRIQCTSDSLINSVQVTHFNNSNFIVGGETVQPHAFPWKVSLHFVDTLSGWYGHNCGGVLISNRWVLSAAHCIAMTGVGFYEIWAGKHNLSAHEPSEQIRLVEISILHPNYNPLVVGPFDIALLRSNSSILFTPAIQEIPLPSGDYEIRGDVIIAGWGSNVGDNMIMPDVLYAATVPTLPFEACASILADTLFGQTNFCTGPLEGGVATCAGDNGGGVIQRINGRYVLVGIVSWGWFPCAQPCSPMVHERVSHYVTWIKNVMDGFS